MLGIGPWELILIFAIVLLMFGGKRLPGIATGLGTAIRNFKQALNEPLPQEGEKTPKLVEVKDAEVKQIKNV